MKLFREMCRKLTRRGASKSVPGTAVGINLYLPKPPAFKGFKYTVEEGIRMSKRWYTEIPGLLPDTEKQPDSTRQ